MDPIPQSEIVHLPTFTVVGICKRVILANETDPENNTYKKTFQEFFQNKIKEQIPHRVHPLRTYAIYYDFQNLEDLSKFNYNILIGEVVLEIGDLPEGLSAVEVEESSYAKFKAGPGPIPQIVKSTWISLCKLTPEQWGGKRTFKTEFELYPEGQEDLEKMMFELFVGISQE